MRNEYKKSEMLPADPETFRTQVDLVRGKPLSDVGDGPLSAQQVRNTFPYKVNEIYADNDFIIEPNEISDQYAVIESTTPGKVESFDISDGGDNYSVGDRLLISDENYGGVS